MKCSFLLSGFLFGYEDELACILDGDSGATGGETADQENEEEEWVDWEEDQQQQIKQETTLDGIPSYRSA